MHNDPCIRALSGNGQQLMMRKPACTCLLLLALVLPKLQADAEGSHTSLRDASPAVQQLILTALKALNDGSYLNLTGTSFQNAGWNLSYHLAQTNGLGLQAQEQLTEQVQKLQDAVFNSLATNAQAALLGHKLELVREGQSATAEDAVQHSTGAYHSADAEGSSSAAEKAVPGIIAVVHPEFFTRASAVAVQLLKENFKKVHLESITTVAHVPVIGDFTIKLENVKLEGVSLDQTSTGVSLGADGTFVLLVTGLNAIVDVHLQWRRTKFPFISGGCQAKLTAEDGNAKLRVAVVGDGSGRPQITGIRGAELSFSSIAISTSEAKLAWLYNIVAALAKTPIQDAITREVAAQLTTTVPAEVNKLMLGIPTTVTIKGLELNTSLARDPSVTADRLIVWDWGRFQNPGNRWQECPFVRRQNSLGGGPIMPGGSPYMLVANIDESIVNCLTWDMYKKGMLGRMLAGDDAPKRALYTDTWRLVIPAVYNKCPSCPMALNATVSTAPHTAIQPGLGMVTTGTAELSFFLADSAGPPGEPWTPVEPAQNRKLSGGSTEGAASSGGSRAVKDHGTGGVALGEHLFTLSLSGELSVRDLQLEHDLPDRPEGWRLALQMKVNETTLAVDVLESDVGPINKAKLHLALTVAAFLVEDEINKGILKDGFALPDIPHITVERANVTVAKAALALGSDVKYAG